MIHPTAIVEKGAIVPPTASIGAFSYIGAEVELGDGVDVQAYSYIVGDTKIGANSQIFPFCSIGIIPQDLKFGGEKTATRIGARNRIREHVTIHAGTEGGGGVTTIGDDNLLMVGVHVAHDCVIGNKCIMVNNSALAGHVVLEDQVVVGGKSAIHQFVHVGKHAMIGGMSGIERDVVPFSLTSGERSRITGLNLIGLRRRGFENSEISELKSAMNTLFFGDGDQSNRLLELEAIKSSVAISELVEFVQQSSKRGLTQADSQARF